MIRVDVNVNDAAALLAAGAYGPGALLRLERAVAEAGAFAQVASTALVAGTDAYTIWDQGGSTTSWYRTRVSDAAGAQFSGYSDPFQVGELAAYASVEDLVELLPPSSAARNRNLLSDILVRASSFVTSEVDFDFLRHPTTGEETRTYNVAGATRSIRISAGIVSASLIEYATATGAGFTALPADVWALVESQPGSGLYDRLVLTDVSPIVGFYAGRGVLRITGVFGYATVPEIVRAGTLALARLMYATEATANGGPKAAAVLEDSLPLETAAAIRWIRRLAGASTRTTSRGIRSVRMSTAGWRS